MSSQGTGRKSEPCPAPPAAHRPPEGPGSGSAPVFGFSLFPWSLRCCRRLHTRCLELQWSGKRWGSSPGVRGHLPTTGQPDTGILGSLCELGVSLGQQNDPKAGAGSAPLLLGAGGVSRDVSGLSRGSGSSSPSEHPMGCQPRAPPWHGHLRPAGTGHTPWAPAHPQSPAWPAPRCSCCSTPLVPPEPGPAGSQLCPATLAPTHSNGSAASFPPGSPVRAPSWGYSMEIQPRFLASSAFSPGFHLWRPGLALPLNLAGFGRGWMLPGLTALFKGEAAMERKKIILFLLPCLALPCHRPERSWGKAWE